MSNISIKQLLEAGVHFGHRTRYWNPKMKQYIFGERNKIHIINLDKTLPLYKDALNFISSLAAKKGKILFVGTKIQAKEIIREEARRCGMPYVDNRWLGGMLTNYKTIRQSIKKLKDLEGMRNSSVFEKITKKEALLLDREIGKLEQNLGGIKNMNGLPDAIFVVDVGYEKTAVTESKKLRIPIVGIIDTNNSPDGIDYVIPGNDDSARAIKLYAQTMADAIIAARANILEEIEAEEKEARGAKKAAKEKKKVFTRQVVESVETEAKAEVEGGKKVEKPKKTFVQGKGAIGPVAKKKTDVVVKTTKSAAVKQAAVSSVSAAAESVTETTEGGE